MATKLTVVCRHCSAEISVHRDLAGKQVRCPKCRNVFAVSVSSGQVGQEESQQWYFAQGGQQSGPITRGELDRMLVSGSLAASDLVWRDGMQDWVAASTIPGLLPSPVPAPASPDAGSVTAVPREGRAPGESAATRPAADAHAVSVVPPEEKSLPDEKQTATRPLRLPHPLLKR